MSNPDTLRDFILYCKQNYTADRYMLCIYGHGANLFGTCGDSAGNNNANAQYMPLDDIRKALTEAGGVDILACFTPCNMACIEAAYEYRNCTKVYIASEMGSYPWGFVYQIAFNILKNDYDKSDIEIGKKIIEGIGIAEKTLIRKINGFCTMSAISMGEITGLAKAIDNMSKVLDSRMFNRYPKFKNFFDYDYQAFWKIIDIYDFAEYCLNDVNISRSNGKYFSDVMDAINRTIIAEWHNKDWQMAHGLAINYPDFSRQTENLWAILNFSLDHYRNCGLDFTNDTHWDEFLLQRELNYPVVDANGGGNFTCIQDAIDNASDGDVIYIKNGVYHENLVINKSVTLVGEDKNMTIVDGGKKGDVVTIDADDVQLYMLDIMNSSDSGAGIYVKSNLLVIDYCTIQNNYNGIFANKSCNSRFFFSFILNNSGYAIYLSSSNKNKILENCCENNKKHFSFYDSYNNIWLQNTNRFGRKCFYFIFGFVKVGKLSVPSIDYNIGFTFVSL